MRHATASEAPKFQVINVSVPDYVKALDQMIAATPFADLKAHPRWQLLHESADLLPKAFADADFGFFSRTLAGQPEQPPRWRRCVVQTDQQLGEALGKAFVEETFGPQAKADMLQMVQDIKGAMRQDIDAAPWMSGGDEESGDAARVEAGVDIPQAHQAPRQQARSGHEGQCQRQLCDEKGALRAGGVTRHRAMAVAQPLAHVRPRGSNRRDNSADQSAHERRADCDQQDPPVQFDGHGVGQCRRQQAQRCTRAPGRKHDAGERASACEARTLRERLSEDAPPARAERKTGGELLGSTREAREHEVRDVGACDQPHERDRGQQEQQRGADVPGEILRQRHHAGALTAIRVRYAAARASAMVDISACASARPAPGRSRPITEAACTSRDQKSGSSY